MSENPIQDIIRTAIQREIDAYNLYDSAAARAEELHAKEILDLRGRLNQIYANHTGQKVAAIEKALDRDNFMTAEAAKDFGIIDSVISKRPEPEGEDE